MNLKFRFSGEILISFSEFAPKHQFPLNSSKPEGMKRLSISENMNAPFSMNFNCEFSGISIHFNLKQLQKALSPMLVTVAGIEILPIDVSEKARIPKDCRSEFSSNLTDLISYNLPEKLKICVIVYSVSLYSMLFGMSMPFCVAENEKILAVFVFESILYENPFLFVNPFFTRHLTVSTFSLLHESNNNSLALIN